MDDITFKNLEEQLKIKFPLGIPRKKVGDATGGLLHPRTMANQDSLGVGIKNRFSVGRITVYPVVSLVEYIKYRTSIVVS